MWIAKLIVPANKEMLLASRTKKYGVTIMGYPLSHFWKDNTFYLLASAFLFGNSQQKKLFLQDLKKDTRAVRIDMMNDHFGFWLMEQHPSIEVLDEPLIIHVRPVVISKDGNNVWEIASWEKEKLMRVATLVQTPLYGGKLVFLHQKNITSIAVVTPLPQLTEKQRRAIDLAVDEGYYGYPRKIDLVHLAKLMGVSYSTYQFHLRTAERKLLPTLKSS